MAEIDSSKSSLIFIRHGKSLYTNKFPDLTEAGVEQVRKSAEGLKPFIDQYETVHAFSSPAVRAMGSAWVFLNAIGRSEQTVTCVPDLSPVKIKDFPNFLAVLNKPGYSKEYEAWLRDPVLDSPDNEFSERRSQVNRRALRFLSSFALDGFEQKPPECSLYFTHFEIILNYLNAIYRHPNPFPIEHEDGPKNGEVIIFQPDKYNPRDVLVTARSKTAKIRLYPELGDFEKVE